MKDFPEFFMEMYKPLIDKMGVEDLQRLIDNMRKFLSFLVEEKIRRFGR